MTLSEKSRSAIYQGLASVVHDEEAIEEMLSHFPAREIEEVVTKDFLRAELAELRSEMRSGIGGLRDEMRSEIGGLRVELHAEVRRALMWMVTISVTGWGLVIAATAGIVAALR